MTSQSIFKHILTEGDRFLVSKFSKLEDQGGYAVATNYGMHRLRYEFLEYAMLSTLPGSLVARIFFQPIEESSRLFFSKLLSSKDTSNGSAEDTSDSSRKLKQAVDVAHLVLLLYIHLGLVFMVFGSPYIPTLLSLALPSRYKSTSASLVLQAYCVYLPVMALNGFLEAFVSSTASPADLAAQSRFMGICSIFFVVGAVTLSEGFGMHETGLVYANVINLGARAAFGWHFLKRYFKVVQDIHANQAKLISGWKCLPPRAVWITSAIAGCIVRLSAAKYGSISAGIEIKALHVVIGGVQFVIWLFVW
jgi:oligosaccharide translocation protein RFT1